MRQPWRHLERHVAVEPAAGLVDRAQHVAGALHVGRQVALIYQLQERHHVSAEEFRPAAVMRQRDDRIERVEVALHGAEIGFQRPKRGDHAAWNAIFALGACLSLPAQSDSPMTVMATLPNASASAVASDAAGNVYVAGTTHSNQFRTTPDALKSWCEMPCWDAVLAIFDRSGQLVYATYLGGTGAEDVWDLHVDADANVFIAGTTWSSNFPLVNSLVPPRAAQQSYLVKISPDRRLVYSTMLGGSGATAVTVGGGDIYVLTLSSGEVKRLTFDDTTESLNGWSRDGKWIYSRHTGARYCPPGTPHKRVPRKKQQEVKDSWPSIQQDSVQLAARYELAGAA